MVPQPRVSGWSVWSLDLVGVFRQTLAVVPDWRILAQEDAMTYQARKADSGKWQVGFWTGNDVWQPLTDVDTKEECEQLIEYMGGTPKGKGQIDEATH